MAGESATVKRISEAKPKGDKPGSAFNWQGDLTLLNREIPPADRWVERMVEYFQDCHGRNEVPNKPGLALAMGYTGWDSLKSAAYQWKEADPRLSAFKKARQYMEQMLNQAVTKANPVGPMFLLKASHLYNDKAGEKAQKGQDRGSVTLAIAPISGEAQEEIGLPSVKTKENPSG